MTELLVAHPKNISPKGETVGEKIVLHEIVKDPDVQHYCAGLLSGFVKLAKTIKIGNKIFSAEDRTIQKYEDDDELKADLMFLRFIFNDKDHRIKQEKVSSENVYYLDGTPRYIFDLGSCMHFFDWTYSSSYRLPQVKFFLEQNGIKSAKLLIDKISRFKDYISNLSDVQIGVNYPFAESQSVFREQVLFRLDFMLKLTVSYVSSKK